MTKKDIAHQPRRNGQIKAPEVRLIDDQGVQVGIIPTAAAMAQAAAAGLDLVEVAPDAKPPVCKIVNWSKEQYENDKAQRQARRKQQAQHVVKEVQLKPGIDTHDLATKAQAAERFLAKGAKVRVVVTLFGRLASRPEEADRLLERFYQQLDAQNVNYVLDGPAQRSGRKVIQSLAHQ